MCFETDFRFETTLPTWLTEKMFSCLAFKTQAPLLYNSILKEQLLCSYSPSSAHPAMWLQFRECWRRPYDNFNYSELSFGLLKLITILLKIPPPPDKTSPTFLEDFRKNKNRLRLFWSSGFRRKKNTLNRREAPPKISGVFFRLKLISQKISVLFCLEENQNPCRPFLLGTTEDRTSVLSRIRNNVTSERNTYNWILLFF